MGEEFEDNKGVIRISKSKDRQHNGQKKKDKQQYTTRTSIKTEVELRCSETMF